jgi:hypothetical protein
MKSITFRKLSLSEAEDLLVSVWLIIEKHQIATPKLASNWQSDQLDIVLTFGSEAERAAVELQIRGYARKNISGVGFMAVR